jgi:Protein of unknown function (DUF2877)
MTLSGSGRQQRDAAAFGGRSADRPDKVVPILRSGVLARQFCQGAVCATVEAVFDRCIYLRSGGDFVCIGVPDIGNGPTTLIANLEALPFLQSLVGQVALIRDDEWITIGNAVRFTLDQTEPWRPLGWPTCPPPDRLIDICATLASRAAVGAPQEGLARCIACGSETSARQPALARVACPRIVTFERWMSGVLDGEDAPVVEAREAVRGLIGLGPGLTPSGDDFLTGALAVLDALGESEAHAAIARAIVEVLPGLTGPLSACFLRAAAAGHVGETLHQVVSLLIAGDVDAAVAVAGKIGHSSGWDMMAGVLTTLRIAAARRKAPSAACTLDSIFSKGGTLNVEAA